MAGKPSPPDGDLKMIGKKQPHLFLVLVGGEYVYIYTYIDVYSYVYIYGLFEVLFQMSSATLFLKDRCECI